MSLASQVSALATRIATEIKAVRNRANHTGTQSAITVDEYLPAGQEAQSRVWVTVWDRDILKSVDWNPVAWSLARRDGSGGLHVAATTDPAHSARKDYVDNGLAGKAPALTVTTAKTAPYTVAVGEMAVMNVAGGATTLTLPASPTDKARVGFRSVGANTTTPLTIVRGGTATIGDSGATSVTEPLGGVTRTYQFDATGNKWFPVNDVKPLGSLDSRYTSMFPTVVKASGGVYPARPAGAVQVIWVGTTDPGSASIDGDMWVQA